MEIRTATITEKGQIALPKEIRKSASFKMGSKVALLTFTDHIEIRPMKVVSEKMASAFASEKSLSKSWNKKEEAEAWKKL
jgi:AbrB family looped-hinge helix DNA binding protein